MGDLINSYQANQKTMNRLSKLFPKEVLAEVMFLPVLDQEKLSDKAIESARERVVNLKDLLGEAPDMDKVKAEITKAFEKAFNVWEDNLD